MLIVGCEAEKETNHEHTHSEPRHWPDDLAEAATFILQRVESLHASEPSLADEERMETIHELQDLVEWSPEVAADTDLSEEKWIPIFELSEAIRKHMQPGDVDPTTFSSDFDKLVQLLTDAHVQVVALKARSVRFGSDDSDADESDAGQADDDESVPNESEPEDSEREESPPADDDATVAEPTSRLES